MQPTSEMSARGLTKAVLVNSRTRGVVVVQAGCYGRAFCPVGSYPRKRILQICQSLRILNALRGSDVGMPLTLPQLEALTPSVLVSRLINGRRHLLALRIAEMLNMDTDKVRSLSSQSQPINSQLCILG